MAKSNVVELDFDLIKDDLKEHLRGQSEFKDFDFEGAGLNIILDLLAKNSHLVAYMANVVGAEMFLDSAELRQSVVSKAREIGYTPRSVRSSQAMIDVILTSVQNEIPDGGGIAEPPPYVEMKAGTQFSGTGSMIFSTAVPHLLFPTGASGEYKVEDIDIFDGRYNSFEYLVDSGLPDQRFLVPDVNADISTLTVNVRPTQGSTIQETHHLNDDINLLTPDSTAFFLSETSEGFYEVYFGDGVLGKKLENGQAIELGYIVSENRGDANGIGTFTAIQRINGQGGNDINTSTKTKSFNGSEKEGIDSIKFNAPRFFQSQKRAVTTKDYEAFLIQKYPFIESINTWGGEYNVPPVYGKVFIAIKPYHTEFLSPTLKESIKADLIKTKNVVTVIPELVDPDYLYVGIDSLVYYTKSKTTKTEAELTTLVTQSIYNYFLETTRKFKMDYQFSPMTRIIDDVDGSIDNSLSDVVLHKRVFPIVGMTQTFTMYFSNALAPNSLQSSFFNTENTEVVGSSVKTGIRDDGNGLLYAFNAVTGTTIKTVGTVNYETGVVSYTTHTYGVPPDTLDVRMYAVPQKKNVTPGNNQIIAPDTSASNGDYMRLQGITPKMVLTITEVA